MLYLLLAVPIITAAICLLPLEQQQWESANRLGAVLTGALACYCSLNAFWIEKAAPGHAFLVIDGLSSVFVLTIGLVGTISSLYAVNYLRRDQESGEIEDRRIGHFYALLHLFIASMYLAVLADSLGVMWVAIEATTIVSALLVGFYGNRLPWRPPGNTSLSVPWGSLLPCSGLSLPSMQPSSSWEQAIFL